MRHRNWKALLALGCLVAPGALAQVRLVTLGITTHCPYGVGGCWAEIRNGLNLPDAIAAVPQKPDTTTQTFDLHMRESWQPDPDLFTSNFRKMNVGVDVRGVEAMVDGSLERQGTNLLLRVNSTGPLLRLAPIAGKVQWDVKRNRPQALTRSERKAFEKLVARFTKQPGRVRVVGPMMRSPGNPDQPCLTLEVRKFQEIAIPGG